MNIPWVDIDAGRGLCHAVNAATSEPDAQLALAELNRCIDLGWTPFFHDFMVGKAPALLPASKSFASRDRHAPCFARILDVFPAAQGYYPLWEGLNPEKASDAEVSKFMDSPRSPWQALGPVQREILISFDGGAALLPPSNPAAFPLWLKLASLALLPPTASLSDRPAFPVGAPAFYGFFDSAAWSGLATQRPEAAHDLAACLYLQCALMSVDGASGADPWIKAAAQQAAAFPGPLSTAAGFGPRSLASACACKFIALDRADMLLALMDIFAIDANANEKEEMSAQAAGDSPGSLKDRMDHSSKKVRAFQVVSGSPLIKMADLSVKHFGSRHFTLHPVDKLPLFTLVAVMEASACWDALVSRIPAPTSLNVATSHQLKLASPAEIAHRIKSHTGAAFAASKKPVDAVAALKRNLAAESARAAMVISALPLPAPLKNALLGDHPEPVATRLEIHPEDLAAFASACEKAGERVKEGRLASLALPLRFDWTLHLLSGGVAPSFLQPRLPCGALSRSARLFDFTEAGGVAGRFRADKRATEMAFIEKDELLHSQSASPAAVMGALRRRL